EFEFERLDVRDLDLRRFRNDLARLALRLIAGTLGRAFPRRPEKENRRHSEQNQAPPHARTSGKGSYTLKLTLLTLRGRHHERVDQPRHVLFPHFSNE